MPDRFEIPTSAPVVTRGEFPGHTDPAGRNQPDGYQNPQLDISVPLSVSGYHLAPIGTTIPELQKMIHNWAISKEWRGPNAETQRTTGDDIALIVSEAAEALEAFRECNDPNKVWYTYTVEVDGIKFKDMLPEQLMVLWDCDSLYETYEMIQELNLKPKPEGVGPELSDLVIRVLDYCEDKKINLLHFLMEKMEHNATREIRHGGKHL